MTTIKSILEELAEYSRLKAYSPGYTKLKEKPIDVSKYLLQIEQLIEEANVTLNEVDVPETIDAYHYAVDVLRIHKANLKKVIR